MLEIGVCTVATNRYLDYWSAMARSADALLFSEGLVTLHVFTDQPERVEEIAADLKRVTVRVFEVPPMGWPAATLGRYRLISDFSKQIQGQILMHVDADMLFVGSVGSELQPTSWPNGLAFVRHPGYFRPRKSARLELYARSARTAYRDSRSLLQMGALGFWEKREASEAFVPLRSRHNYYCGGVWFGLREPIVKMCGELAAATEVDAGRGLTAVWHDESHLNRYASQRAHAALGPEYCYVTGYPQLRGIAPRIVAVDKGGQRTR